MSAESLDITVTHSPEGVVHAAFAGEFDLVVCDLAAATLQPYLAEVVTVDLTAVAFIDSSALHCLFDLRREAARRGGRLSVGAASRVVLRLFELSGLGPALMDLPPTP
jgi:anti-anti-sigma factor